MNDDWPCREPLAGLHRLVWAPLLHSLAALLLKWSDIKAILLSKSSSCTVTLHRDRSVVWSRPANGLARTNGSESRNSKYEEFVGSDGGPLGSWRTQAQSVLLLKGLGAHGLLFCTTLLLPS